MVKDGKVMVITNVMYLKRNEMIEKLWIFLMFQGGGGGQGKAYGTICYL